MILFSKPPAAETSLSSGSNTATSTCKTRWRLFAKLKKNVHVNASDRVVIYSYSAYFNENRTISL